ncbi:hypothetical protein TNCV_1506671 [Trichonephila clavipes]|nr:hypothetical protein TNCV_1506671 [Trichonephila clavipes]
MVWKIGEEGWGPPLHRDSKLCGAFTYTLVLPQNAKKIKSSDEYLIVNRTRSTDDRNNAGFEFVTTATELYHVRKKEDQLKRYIVNISKLVQDFFPSMRRVKCRNRCRDGWSSRRLIPDASRQR